MTCSRPRSGLSLPNSRHFVCSPAPFLQVTKVPETIGISTKSPKPKGYPTGATSIDTPGNLLAPTAVIAMEARDKRSEASRGSVIHENAAPSSSSSKSKLSNTKTRTTNTRREFLSETSGAFPAEVSKMDLAALAKSVKNWSDLRQLVKQQRRKDEQFVLRLLKLEWLQLKTVETERKRERSKQSTGGVASPCPSSADPPSPLRSMSQPTIHARHGGCGQGTPPATKHGSGLDAALSTKSTASGTSVTAVAAAAARRRTALAARPRSSYNYRDVSRAGKTVAERRSGRTCISPDLRAKHRNRTATPLQLANKALKESVRVMLGLPLATPSQIRQN